MIFFKKPTLIAVALLLANIAFAQTINYSIRTNPIIELEINTKTLELKGNIKEMQAHKFALNDHGQTTNDSASVSHIYKFNQNGSTKEIEETFRNFQTKKSFFSYTNSGYISHIDIETILLSNQKDSTAVSEDNTDEGNPIFSTIDYKYVQKKNILFKGEDIIQNMPQKATTRKEYFYHFNDANQIFQVDYQSSDLTTKYNYGVNGLIKESLTLKSGMASHKNVYKYDRNNRLIHVAKINSDNTTKFPSEETVITYKLDSNGNAIERKEKTFVYSPKGSKKFMEGHLYLYNYTYL